MEILIIILALFVSAAIGAGFGFYVASKWQFYLKIAKKEDYDAKVLELENMIQNLMETSQKEMPEYSAYDMFPPNLDPEYGLPKSMKR
jgi:hypothetical protein